MQPTEANSLDGTTLASAPAHGPNPARYSTACIRLCMCDCHILRRGERSATYYATSCSAVVQGRHQRWRKPRRGGCGADQARFHRKNLRVAEGSSRSTLLAPADCSMPSARRRRRCSATRGMRTACRHPHSNTEKCPCDSRQGVNESELIPVFGTGTICTLIPANVAADSSRVHNPRFVGCRAFFILHFSFFISMSCHRPPSRPPSLPPSPHSHTMSPARVWRGGAASRGGG
jgi:hypothetical protein